MPTAQQVVWDNTAGETPATLTIPVNAAISGANASAIIAAAMAMSLGGVGRSTLVIDTLLAAGTSARPGNVLAQKENRFKVSFTDDVTGKKYYFTIPCADLSLLPDGSEEIPLGDTEAAALVTAFETNGRSELGNAVTVDSISFMTL